MSFVLEFIAAELDGLAKALNADAKIMQQAARVAANRAIRLGRAQIARGLSARLGLPQGAISKRMRERKATARKSRASLWLGLNPVNVGSLNPRKTSKGLRAGRTLFPGAFLGRGRYGGKVAYRRAGTARLPLETVVVRLYDPAREYLAAGGWASIHDRFVEIYLSEVEKRVARAGAR